MSHKKLQLYRIILNKSIIIFKIKSNIHKINIKI